MRLPLGPGDVNRVHNVPVLQAVHDDPAVEGVVELPIHSLEMSVAMIVGLLIGGQVVQNHLELPSVCVCVCGGVEGVASKQPLE